MAMSKYVVNMNEKKEEPKQEETKEEVKTDKE